MKRTWFCPVILISLLLAGGCASTRLEESEALKAVKLEIQMDGQGGMREIEYHIRADEVPVAVRSAMDELHPGGAYTAAEREHEGGVLYFELSREVDGLEVEAMFHPDGRLHSEEISVAESKVPPAVRTAARGAVSGATVTNWEEIRDSNRKLVEYHVKLAQGDRRYKVLLGTDGAFLSLYREIPAEIEVRQR